MLDLIQITMSPMTVAAVPGVAPLVRSDAERALLEHPALTDPDAPHPVVFMVSARDDDEASELADLISAARSLRRSQGHAARAMIAALLPAERLTLGPAMLRQLERNAVAKQALTEEFGLLSSADVARCAGSAANNVAALASRWRSRGKIFAVEVDGGVRYPGFQLDHAGRPLPVVADLIAALSPVLTGWELALWFTGGSASLEGMRPVDVMTGTSEDAAAVVETARAVAAELDR